jgi:hypothetical protein
MITDEDIKKLAFAIWEEEGRPDGKDVEHYLRAKKILEEREAKRVVELAPVPQLVELAQPPKNSSSTVKDARIFVPGTRRSKGLADGL